MQPYVSFCVPTNGIKEWVIPVLDSIYCTNADIEEFEVIITDNGNDKDFYETLLDYCKDKSNCIYKRTDAIQFLNQIEAFKMASGKLIKFVNHRHSLVDGAVQYLIEVSKKYSDLRPELYFMNGAIAGKSGEEVLNTFDEFVYGMQRFSSWSAGTAMWKEEFEKISDNKKYNRLFPHIDLIFNNKEASKYIIDHTVLFKEIMIDDSKKGKYDLFYAFGVEYPAIILELYRQGEISYKTFDKVKESNLVLLAQLYYAYVLRKKECSYDLSSFSENIQCFYSKTEIWKMIIKIAIGKLKFWK